LSPSEHEGSALDLGSMGLTISNLPPPIRLNWVSRDAAPKPDDSGPALPGRFAGHRRHGRDLSMARYPLYFVMGIGSACGACKSPRVTSGPPQPSRPYCSHACSAVPAAPRRAAAVCAASGAFAGV
jgi:hypothetical protein